MKYDLIVIGAGAAGMLAAITAARRGCRVLLLEKQNRPGAKLRASGGGRCNIANTLSNEKFIARFGRSGKFMIPALREFDHQALIAFFAEIGVACHAPDGYRIFPVTHQADTVADALTAEMQKLSVELACNTKVQQIDCKDGAVTGVTTDKGSFSANSVILASGGPGYPSLGADASGYELAAALGHKIEELFPAMLPLTTRETWVARCRADTVGKVEMRINLPEAKKLQAIGDLIFTENGIRGPVVLDFAREITPLLKRYGEVPLLVNLCKGMNEEQIRNAINMAKQSQPAANVIDLLAAFINRPLAGELCRLVNIDPETAFGKLPGQQRDNLIKLLTATPLTVIGHAGFAAAMVTRGGVSLKQIKPETLESLLVKGLYFCGEIVDLDGPCGGYNLQWAFSSGHLAGQLK
jgi:predicted Rossmann fold flavoprotein